MITYSKEQRILTEKLLKEEVTNYLGKNPNTEIKFTFNNSSDGDDKKINVRVFSYEEMKDLDEKFRMPVFTKALQC